MYVYITPCIRIFFPSRFRIKIFVFTFQFSTIPAYLTDIIIVIFSSMLSGSFVTMAFRVFWSRIEETASSYGE
jgi:hypothetical protein